MRRVVVVLVIIAAIAVFCALPFMAGRYVLRFLTSALMFCGLAVSWNIIGGLAGYFSFGHVVFFGIGVYSVALLMVKVSLPFWVGIGVGALVATLFALLIGLPVLRLKGHYFALVTVGVGEVVRGVVNNLTALTGGAGGLSLPLPSGTIDSIQRWFYFLMLGTLMVALGVVLVVLRSRLGYGLLAIREDEEAAATLGIPTTRYKVTAFAISGALFSVFGGIYAYWLTYVEPADAFDIRVSILTMLMALLGGLGTVIGPVIGALVFQVLSEVLWNRLLHFHSAFVGLLMIVIVMFFPKGIVEVVRRGFRGAVRQTAANLRQYAEVE
jgi:branched-chain amino acid transport system permease protein